MTNETLQWEARPWRLGYDAPATQLSWILADLHLKPLLRGALAHDVAEPLVDRARLIIRGGVAERVPGERLRASSARVGVRGG